MEHWWTNAAGYIEGRVLDHDGNWRRVKQHRWLLEKHLGRRLARTEIVHHKNGKRTDNRINNLAIMDRGSHAKHHLPENGDFTKHSGDASHLVKSNRARGPWNKGGTLMWHIACDVCGTVFQRKAAEVRKSIKRGWRTTCSRKCAAQPK